MSLINKNEVLGLISLLLFVIFSCIRLAKFNTEKFNKTSDLRYFNGVPTPAGCGLLILPLIHSENLADHTHFYKLFDVYFKSHPKFQEAKKMNQSFGYKKVNDEQLFVKFYCKEANTI